MLSISQFCVVILISLFTLILIIRLLIKMKLRRMGIKNRICIFHPWCEDGGGGERVLWCAVDAIKEAYPDMELCIYSSSNVLKDLLLKKIDAQFGFKFKPSDFSLVPLRSCFLLLPIFYPMFTMLMQSVGSMIVAFEAVCKQPPLIFIDTTGVPFTYLPIKLLTSSKIVSYIHYPTISCDMINDVEKRKSAFNNTRFTSLPIISSLKLIYYKIFALFYTLCGKQVDVCMVNSTWTFNHIVSMWKMNNPKTSDVELREKLIVYPPCGTERYQNFPKTDREYIILSLSQYRPEKNQIMQLHIFKKLLERVKCNPQIKNIKMVIIGGCRHKTDEILYENLKKVSEELGIQDNVNLIKNASNHEVNSYLSRSLIGIHTMENEHFGIGIVEMAASGLIVVCHKSGGPLTDIFNYHTVNDGGNGQNPTESFLVSTIDEYVKELLRILKLSDTELEVIRVNSLNYMNKTFSNEAFIRRFIKRLSNIISS